LVAIFDDFALDIGENIRSKKRYTKGFWRISFNENNYILNLCFK
jgi:hypothetical protein